MYVYMDEAGTATLEEAQVLNDFKVVAPGWDGKSLGPGDFAEIGLLDDDRRHVWVDAEWLRRAGPTTMEWQEKLAKVIAYAATQGWCDPAGRIRAHIEFKLEG